MLIRFEVANFRSMRDPIELSMVAVDRDRKEARPMPNLGESLVPVAAVLGPNASGKSNVIEALRWLCSAVRDSLRLWDDEIPVEPFAFGDARDRSTRFVFEAVVKGVRFEYIVELNRSAVRYEGLFHYPEKRRRRIFEREGDDLTLQRGLSGLSGTRELLTPRVLALSIARRFDEPLITSFARELTAAQALGQRTRRSSDRVLERGSTSRRFEEEAADREEAMAMLQLADLGIEDVVLDTTRFTTPADDGEPEGTFTYRRVRLVHRTADGGAPLDLHAESEGTRTWFGLIGPVLDALRAGSLVLFDELDAGLHPTLSAELIRLFHDPTTNPHGAQLVFTTHDTSLLNHLNRDEVWLTEKSEEGVTRLGALADFAGERVRRSQNLERAYLHGRFGAVPDIDRTDVLRAFGLTG